MMGGPGNTTKVRVKPRPAPVGGRKMGGPGTSTKVKARGRNNRRGKK